ncbi:MAG: MarR family transcriptional regulator [Comamonadaceae bacterium]|nr:MAG: MarR family transcriptional regulator [Comamonadaceae bacterium]
MADAPEGVFEGLLLYRISRVLAVAGGMVTRLCEGRFGITRREWRLIAVLAGHGALASSELAIHAQLDRARTSRAIGSLVAKGLLSRTQAPGDRRLVALRLTEAGIALHAELLPLASAINTELLGALDPTAAAALDQALDRLQAQADRMSAAAVLPKAARGRRG